VRQNGREPLYSDEFNAQPVFQAAYSARSVILVSLSRMTT